MILAIMYVVIFINFILVIPKNVLRKRFMKLYDAMYARALQADMDKEELDGLRKDYLKTKNALIKDMFRMSYFGYKNQYEFLMINLLAELEKALKETDK